MSINETYEKETGEELLWNLPKIVSDLWRDKSIGLVLFRNQLIDHNVSDILNLHEYT